MSNSSASYKKKWPWIFYLLPFIIVSGVYLIYEIDKIAIGYELEKRTILLQNESKVAATHLQKGIEKFSLIVFNIRSFLSDNPNKNNALELQKFLKLQLQNHLSQDSLVVSFLDTSHIFQYSITPHSLTPNSLKGVSVRSLRSETELEILNDVMKKDNLVLFPPFNLVEGWSGIPLNFRIIENGILQGYIAPIISLQSILDEVYKDVQSKDFVYHFSTKDGLSFDRNTVYDSQKKYSSFQDPESFKNFDIPAQNFHYSNFTLYGYEFKVGAAYKQPYQRSFTMLLALSGWMIIFSLSILGLIIFWKLQAKRHELLKLKIHELTLAMEGLENFIRASSHDLKEPLRNIGSFSTLLNRQYHNKLDETANQYLEYITSGVENMSGLLDDLLVYSNLIYEPDWSTEKVNLNLLVDEIIKTQDSKKSSPSVKIDKAKLPVIYFDRGQAYHLFSHLISNSIKHNSNTSPIISIGYSKADNHHLFSIKDNGTGIDQVYHKQIFEVFKRLSRKKSGNGIGLAICKKIVTNKGGHIWLESTKNSNTFHFTLPF